MYLFIPFFVEKKTFVTFLGWLSDPFQWLSDLQLGDEKVTLNHLVGGNHLINNLATLSHLSLPFGSTCNLAVKTQNSAIRLLKLPQVAGRLSVSL